MSNEYNLERLVQRIIAEQMWNNEITLHDFFNFEFDI